MVGKFCIEVECEGLIGVFLGSDWNIKTVGEIEVFRLFIGFGY
jgi:hypothetical protein